MPKSPDSEGDHLRGADEAVPDRALLADRLRRPFTWEEAMDFVLHLYIGKFCSRNWSVHAQVARILFSEARNAGADAVSVLKRSELRERLEVLVGKNMASKSAIDNALLRLGRSLGDVGLPLMTIGGAKRTVHMSGPTERDRRDKTRHIGIRVRLDPPLSAPPPIFDRRDGTRPEMGLRLARLLVLGVCAEAYFFDQPREAVLLEFCADSTVLLEGMRTELAQYAKVVSRMWKNYREYESTTEQMFKVIREIGEYVRRRGDAADAAAYELGRLLVSSDYPRVNWREPQRDVIATTAERLRGFEYTSEVRLALGDLFENLTAPFTARAPSLSTLVRGLMEMIENFKWLLRA